MKTYRITAMRKKDIVFDKTVRALNKANAFAMVKSDILKWNYQVEIEIKEVEGESNRGSLKMQKRKT